MLKMSVNEGYSLGIYASEAVLGLSTRVMLSHTKLDVECLIQAGDQERMATAR